MATDATVSIRRAEIAAMLANPYEPMPSKKELAERYSVDTRTIYRDLQSDEVQDFIQEIIGRNAGTEGIAAAYKVILSAIAGRDVTRKEQLEAAKWLLERCGIHFTGKIEHFIKELLPAPSEEKELSDIVDASINEKLASINALVDYTLELPEPGNGKSGNGNNDPHKD